MPAAGGASSETGWLGSVRVDEDVPLREEILRRSALGSDGVPLSVSDLLAPRRAFWRRRAPATPIAEDRRGRMAAGRFWHGRLAAVLPREGVFEVRLRRDGIAGRIDLLADVPVEVKTGAAVGADRLIELRPDHVEQIGMYCALAERPAGRIVTISAGSEGNVDVEAADVLLRSPEEVALSVRRRAQAVRDALGGDRPTGLPLCRWFGRRCEFQEAHVCDCGGDEPAPPDDILEGIGPPRPRPDIEERWREALNAPAPPQETAAIARYRDLVYPRRGYYERTGPPPPVVVPEAAPAPAPGPDLYDRLVEAIESGPVGDVARLPPVSSGADEEVAGYRGAPYLVRTSRAWSRIRPGEAATRFPQYALELGFRCAATGTTEGRVFLGYERAERSSDRFEVLRYRFEPVSRFTALWAEGARALESAVAAGAPEALPPCPAWMYEGCPYRTRCGCGPGSGRSQR